jgi:hypothetical protein
MFELADMGRLLIIIGVFLIIFGLVFYILEPDSFPWHLPAIFFSRGAASASSSL